MEQPGNIAPAAAESALSEAEQAAIQAGLWELLADQAALYTMGDSSSVPVETARELLRSIRFCIDLELEGTPPGQRAARLRAEPLEGLFAAGRKRAWALTEAGRELLARAEGTALGLGNQSYEDTLAGLPGFFTRYDVRYLAHRVPCAIDYQLLRPVPEAPGGICFICEYLRRLILENRLCGRFPRERVTALLRAAYADYRGLLVNLCDPVLTNALALLLLGEEPDSLHVGPGHRAALLELFRPWRQGRVEAAVDSAARRLCRWAGLEDSWSRQYLRQVAGELLPRVRATAPDAYGRLFPSPR